MEVNIKHIKIIILSILILLFISCNIFYVDAVSYDTASSAKDKINNGILQHKSKITLYTKKNINISYVVASSAMSSNITQSYYTKEPQKFRGDYNRLVKIKDIQFSSWKIINKNKTYYKHTITFKYTNNKKKDDYIDKKCKSVAKKHKRDATKTKVKKICLWMSKNMTYKITRQPTIYDAVKNKRGQCSHYSALFYKIAKDAGLEVRLIAGQARSTPISKYEKHMWCIVKSGKKWYYVDPTWADNGNSIDTKWIMKGKNNLFFKLTHKPFKKYETLMNKKCKLAK